MIAHIEIEGKTYTIDLQKGIDLSIPLSTQEDQVNAYYAHPVKMEPYRAGNFIGSVEQGGSVNYRDISFNPHGNGTHTECVGHITEEVHSVNKHFTDYWQLAQLISIDVQTIANGDQVVALPEGALKPLVANGSTALIIRTLPNSISKRSRQYSGANPPYLTDDFIKQIVDTGIKHLLLDLPSVDKEVDDGKLLGHRAFWMPDGVLRLDCTITELIYVPQTVDDGTYFLNLQVAPFENDAAPSRPLIFAVKD